MNSKSHFFCRKLRTHLLMLIILIFLPVSGLLIFRGYEDRQQSIEDIQSQAHRLIYLFIDEQIHIADNTRHLLEILSQIPAVRNLDLEECNKLLQAVHRYNPRYSTIVAANRDGMIECCAIPLKKPIDVKDRNWFKRISETRKFVIDEFLISKSANKASLPFAYPVLNDSGDLLVAVGAAFDLSYYKQIFAKVPLPPDSVIIITDRKGNVLYLSQDSKNEIELGQPLARIRGFRVPDEPKGSFMLTDTDGIERIYHFEHVSAGQSNNEVCMFVGFSKHEVFRNANRMMLTDISVLSLVALLSLGVAWIFGGKYIVEPVNLLVRKIRKISQGDLNISENIVYPMKELQILSQAFDDLAHALSVQETERKHAEEALRQREIFFRSLIENLPQQIFVKDKNSVYLSCNRNFARDIGHDPEQIIGKDDFAFFPKEMAEAFRADDQAVISKRIVKDIEEKYMAAGEEQWAHTIKVPYYNDQGDIIGLIGIYENITERKKAAEEKAKLESRLRQAQSLESIGTLAGGIAHDFNNILFPIIGYTEMTLDTLPKNSTGYANLEQILKAALRAKDLVTQILTFSRQREHEKTMMKIQVIIKEALKLIRSTLPSTIKISQNIDPNCAAVICDPTQVHQIVMNLCANAYHAMQDNGGVLEVTLTEVMLGANDISAYPGSLPGTYLKLSVSDTGIGISKENLERIFDPFFTTKPVGKGTGLGLSVVHGIVKQMGGHIRVYSELGKGTVFHVYMPAAGEHIPVRNPTVSDESAPGGRERILLADDEMPVLNMLRQMLEELGYRVSAYTDSTEAFAAFRSRPDEFDLVITDMTMPKMTGAQLAQKIFEIRKDIPIVLCTGFSEQINGEKSKALGIRGYLMKPVIRTEMAKMIRKVLEGEME